MHNVDLWAYFERKLELNLKKSNLSDAVKFFLCFYISFYIYSLRFVKLSWKRITEQL